jgi:hypothetical protein
MGPQSYVPTAAAGERLDKSPRTIRRWILDGRLAGERIGKILVADESAVAALEHGRQEGGKSR